MENINSNWIEILTKKEIKVFVQKCADFINTNFEGKDVIVVCIRKGASYFFVDLTRKLKVLHSTYFIEASSYKDTQTQSENLEILSIINEDKFRGKQVILLDEL